MSILGPSADLSPAQQARAELREAGRTDWRAALAWLERDPETREVWSDAATVAALYRRNTAAAVRGIDAWAQAEGIPPATVAALLLHLQAAGMAGFDATEAD